MINNSVQITEKENGDVIFVLPKRMAHGDIIKLAQVIDYDRSYTSVTGNPVLVKEAKWASKQN